VSASVLKVNADKTEFILIGNPQSVAKVQHFELTIGNSVINHPALLGILVLYLKTHCRLKIFFLTSMSASDFHI